jgi:hypothetical protein
MKIVEESVLKKMNLQRLKSHRTSVLAQINKAFYQYNEEGVRSMKDDVDSTEFDAAIAYRNKVNQYYDAVRTAVKVK